MSTEVDASGTWDASDGVRVLVTPSSSYLSALQTAYQAAYGPGTPPANLTDLQAKAQNAIASNQNFLAIASPTNAQAVAQVQTLTRENTAIIRLLLGLLDSTAGT